MNNNHTTVTLHTLGLEELALTLGILNKGDLGRSAIREVYDGITDEQIEERLTAASHSLMARGYIAISDKGSPILEEELQDAVFPLIRFNSLIQLSLIKEDNQVTSTIHIQKGKTFTSHNIQAGIIHVLEHGHTKYLPDFLTAIFSEIGQGEEAPFSSRQISAEVLAGAMGQKTQMEVEQQLISQSWPTQPAKELASDLLNQTMRVTLVSRDVGSNRMDQAISEASGPMIWLLKGNARSWLFEFSSTNDTEIGTAYRVNSTRLIEHLQRFLG